MGKLSHKSGTEGPNWDPYSFDELNLVKSDGTNIVMHMGLIESVKVNGKEIHSGEGTDKVIEEITGMYFDKWMKIHYKLNEPPNRCPHCNGKHFEFHSGYVGESMQVCSDCNKIVWCEEVTESMIR